MAAYYITQGEALNRMIGLTPNLQKVRPIISFLAALNDWLFYALVVKRFRNGAFAQLSWGSSPHKKLRFMIESKSGALTRHEITRIRDVEAHLDAALHLFLSHNIELPKSF